MQPKPHHADMCLYMTLIYTMSFSLQDKKWLIKNNLISFVQQVKT